MNLKRTKGYRFIGVLLIICMVVTGVPGVCYASEEQSPEQKFRELYLRILETNDTSIYDISDLNLPYMTCYEIMNDVRRNEGVLPFQCYKEYNFIEFEPEDIEYRGSKKEPYLMKFHLERKDEGFQERYKKVQEIIAKEREQLDEKMTDLDKLLWFHEYVVEHLYYKDTGNTADHLGGSTLVQGHGVCEGYERALMLFLKAENIPCEQLAGGAHAWLAVKIDGKWYHVDPTWDDTVASKYGTHYFMLRNDDEFKKTMVKQHASWHLSEYQQQVPPEVTINSTDYTDWYVHKVWNRMYYYDGYWYYVLDNAVRKNNINGTKESILYEGKTLKITGLEDGVLAVSSAEGEKKFDLKEAITPTPTVKSEVTTSPVQTVKPEVTTTVSPTVKPEVTPTVAPTMKLEVTPTVSPTVKPKVTATPKTTSVKNEKIKVGKPANWSLANQKGKKIKILLKKKVTGAKGYEVVYSTDKKFKKSVKKVRFTGRSKLVSKLQKNKIYYVKVRAYKKDSKGKYVFGAYSNVKRIRIKK